MARSWAQRVLDAAETYRDAECAETIARAAEKSAADRASEAQAALWKCKQATAEAAERLREVARQPDVLPSPDIPHGGGQ